MQSVSVPVDGANAAGNDFDKKPYDIYCPLISVNNKKDLNYWKESCEIRNKIPELKSTCYPHCKMKNTAAKKILKQKTEKKRYEMREKTLLYQGMAMEWYKLYYRKGYSLEKLGNKYNVSNSTIRKYILRERQRIKGKHVTTIARV